MIDKKILHDVVICKEDDSILEVSQILRDTQTRHLVVVNENNEPRGIISTVDINNRAVAEGKGPKETKAEEIMTKGISCSEVSESYEEAYKKMVEKETYSLPVCENGKVIGELSFNQLFMKAKEAKE